MNVSIPASALLWMLICVAASAQEPADFYGPRTVTILVGSGPGGLTDLSARVIAAALEKHIPGNPTVIVQNMPGGGSVTMANHLFRSAPDDGTVLGYPVPGMITAQLLEPGRARYDGRALNWIGSAFRTTNTLAVAATSGVTTLDDARRQELFIGASGRGSPLYQIPALAAALLGLELNIVTGYEGGTEVALAMERMEVDGQAIALDFWASTRPAWLAPGRLVHLLRVGPPDLARAPGVPHLRDLVATDRERALIDLFEVGFTLGWPLFAPPGVPADRVDALTTAFDLVVADPEFERAVASSLHIELNPVSGAELTRRIEQALNTPAELVAEAIELMGL